MGKLHLLRVFPSKSHACGQIAGPGHMRSANLVTSAPNASAGTRISRIRYGNRWNVLGLGRQQPSREQYGEPEAGDRRVC